MQGLCKLVGMVVPAREDIAQFTFHAFSVMDADNSDSIEYNEFAVWVSESEDL